MQCTNCESQYELDSSEVNWDGVAVRCTNCGNLFRIRRPDTEEGFVGSTTKPGVGLKVEPETTWLIRLEDGEIKPCRKIKSLQMWIIAGRVTPDAEISKTGKKWKKLKELDFLTPFFELAEKSKKFTERDLPKVEQAADGSMIVHIDQVAGNPRSLIKHDERHSEPAFTQSKTQEQSRLEVAKTQLDPGVETSFAEQEQATLEDAKTQHFSGDAKHAMGQSQHRGEHRGSDKDDDSWSVGWIIAMVAACVAAIAGTLIVWLLNKHPEDPSTKDVDSQMTAVPDEEESKPHVISLDSKEFENTSIVPTANIRGHLPISMYDELYKLDDESLDTLIENESKASPENQQSALLAIAHAEKAIRLQTDKDLFTEKIRSKSWKQKLKDSVYLSRRFANKAKESNHPARNHAKAYADVVNGTRSQDIVRTLQDAEAAGAPKGEAAYLSAILLERDKRFTEALAVLDGHNNDNCLLYTSPSPRDATLSRMPSSA